ncbi:hypothetical protein GCM10007863_29950 [Dyella mobilis]|nr:hypothetical protein GCM10007863_29950 [Dyella mobilis]
MTVMAGGEAVCAAAGVANDRLMASVHRANSDVFSIPLPERLSPVQSITDVPRFSMTCVPGGGIGGAGIIPPTSSDYADIQKVARVAS